MEQSVKLAWESHAPLNVQSQNRNVLGGGSDLVEPVSSEEGKKRHT